MDCVTKPLEHICIRNIIDHLDLNYNILVNKKWKIPIKLSDLIFKIYYGKKKKFGYEMKRFLNHILKKQKDRNHSIESQ